MSARRPVRVLQVVQRFLPELGGTETHVAEVTRRLVGRTDVEVTVLATDRSGTLPATDTVDGVPVLRRRSWPEHSDLYFSPGIARVIADGRWDVVHFQGVHTLVPLVGMLAARRAAVPYVLTFHSGGHSSAGRSAVRGLQWRVLTPLLAGASRLVAVSRFEQRRFAAITGIDPERFTIIQNGGALPPVPDGVVPVAGRIVSSGRLERYKGHHRAIEALPLLRRTVPQAHLVILGSGGYEQALRELAEQLGVADHVRIEHLPPADRSAMALELARAQVMAALSEYEAHPVGVMEAVALGLPVLGAHVAGTGDFVEDGQVTGIALSSTAAEVATALAALMSAHPAGRTRPAPTWTLPTWEECADALARVYRETADAVPAPPARPTVVHVITSLTTGGAERQLEAVTAGSARRSTTVALYEGGPVADAMRARGQDVQVLGMGGWRKVLAVPRLALRLRRLRPDVVHVHLLAAQLWGIPAARLAGVRTVVSSEHSLMADTIENRPLTGWLRWLYLALEGLTSGTVAVSGATRERLVGWGVAAERISVVDNGIDFEALVADPGARNRVRDELQVASGVQLVGAVGRLEEVKRFPQLLRALAPTLARDRRELVLVGDGPLRAPLRTLAEELGVGSAVHVVGPRGDVPAVLAALDVLVSPSRDETFGMAVVEGLGAGLPVVHAQCPALEALRSPPAWALPLPVVGTEAEEATAIRAQVDAALAMVPPDGSSRFPVPTELEQRYGIAATVAALDALHVRLSGTTTG